MNRNAASNASRILATISMFTLTLSSSLIVLAFSLSPFIIGMTIGLITCASPACTTQGPMMFVLYEIAKLAPGILFGWIHMLLSLLIYISLYRKGLYVAFTSLAIPASMMLLPAVSSEVVRLIATALQAVV